MVPEVARFALDTSEAPSRGTTVVVETDRGLQLGIVLECLKPNWKRLKALSEIAKINFHNGVLAFRNGHCISNLLIWNGPSIDRN